MINIAERNIPKDILSNFPFTPPPMYLSEVKYLSTLNNIDSVIIVSASIVTIISPLAIFAPAFRILDKFLSLFFNVTQL
ncbi:Uncharacterised protein [Streptococcus pneumoniae]|nr:Uncharacterised protein [Streptococcus pneumoniae]CJH05742.1 Uncharacterised protein [Streptococcus pneumoniae]CJH73526.1 Uncharacterised protein [Streptococcus pneumoniae]